MSEPFDVVVVGSANADLVVDVPRQPGAGETVLGSDVRYFPGGKGANQALAASRAGGVKTAFLGAVGRDGNAQLLLTSLSGGGVDVSHVERLDVPTGLALITISPDGDNSIVVAPGANGRLRLDADKAATVGLAKAVLAQLEIPLETVSAAAQACQGVFVLNAAPSRPLPAELLAAVDVLVVNEHEAADVTGGGHGLDGLAGQLLDLVPAAVVTLGARGSLVAERGRQPVRVPSLAVTAVDTTGAGDTFCGVLAARLAAGDNLAGAARWASVAGALATTKPGAQPSVPSAGAVREALESLP